ncbi:hypothetical protein CVT24_006375 [Panaeolus cyanescens]|uniref:ABM domain-containing protein n=1 Tax=Panaeolus cyanescens TaxID=181874 RepID=A0A409YE67_9AGAR|nr:hypothetical protein CVT24_006375 [Panaeolus cyanescens]
MPVVEFASWPIAEGVDWRTILRPSLVALRQAKGFIEYFVGVPAEDSQRLQFSVAWDAIEDHRALQKSAIYPEMCEAIKACLPAGTEITSLTSYHFDFGVHARTEEEKNFIPALSAPFTEWLFLTLKEGKTKEDLVPLLDISIRDNFTADAKRIKGMHTPPVWAQSVEDPKVFAALFGWDTVAVHTEVAAQDKYGPIIRDVKEVVDMTVTHTPFERNI